MSHPPTISFEFRSSVVPAIAADAVGCYALSGGVSASKVRTGASHKIISLTHV